MFFQGKNEPLGVMKNIQKIYFLSPRDGKTFDVTLMFKHIMVFLASLIPSFVGVGGFVCKAYFDKNLDKNVIKSIYTLTIAAILMSLVFTYMIFGNRITQLLERIQTITTETPEEMVNIYGKIDVISWFISFSLMIILFFISLISYFINAFCEGKAKEDKRSLCGVNGPTWFPFEIEDHSVKKIVLILWHDLGQILYVPIMIITTLGVISVPCFLAARLKHLRGGLENEDIANLTKNFKSYVHYYTEICGCVKDMNNSIGHCLVFQYIFSCMLIGLLGYNIIVLKGKTWLEFGCLGYVLFIEWLFCMNGQNLENEHEKFMNCVYSLKWYKMNANMILNYRVFMEQVKTPMHFRVKPFFIINYPFFLTVFRTGYTILTFLMNTNGE